MSPIQVIFADELKAYCDHVAYRAGRTAGVIKYDKAYCRASFEALLEKGIYNLAFLGDDFDEVDFINYIQLLVVRFPLVSFVAVTRSKDKEYISRLRQAGCKGVIDKRNDGSDMKDSFKPVLSLGWYMSPTLIPPILDDAVETNNDSAKIDEAKLSPKEKEILALMMENKSYKEIGEILKISADDAKARGHKIRLKLRKVGLEYLLDKKRKF